MVQQNRMLFVSCYTVGSGRYYCCVLFFFCWVTLTKWPSIALFKKTTQPTFENVFYTVLFFPCVFFYFKPSFDLVDHLQDHIALGGMEFTVNKVKNPWYNNNFTLFFEIFQFSFQPFGSLEGRYITLPVFFYYTINWAEPMASLMGGCGGLAWAKTKYADKTIDFPDIEFSRISFFFWNTSVW